MKKNLTLLFVLAFLGFSPAENNEANPLKNDGNMSTEQEMKSYISLFEIPAEDITRAIEFYRTILGVEIEKMDISEMQMGILPYEGQAVHAVIIQGEGFTPSANGITIYLNAGDNLQPVLDKVEKHGGKILVPKTAHADGIGFFALFLDSEGNKLGLNSPN